MYRLNIDINPKSQDSIYQSPNFKAKLPVKINKQISDSTLKIFSTAVAVTGIAGLAINVASNQKFPKSYDILVDVKDSAKKNLTPNIPKSVYRNVKFICSDSPESLDDYLDTVVQGFIKDWQALEPVQFDYIQGIIKEIVLERINDLNKPKDFSDIETDTAKNTKIRYKDIFLTEDILKIYIEKGFKINEIANDLKVSPATVYNVMNELKIVLPRFNNANVVLNEEIMRNQNEKETAKVQIEEKVKSKKRVNLPKESLIADLEAGLSKTQIAEKYGCSLPTVYLYIKKYDLVSNKQKPTNPNLEEDLKETLNRIFFEEEKIMDDQELLEMGDFIDNIETFSDEQKIFVSEFIKNLKKYENNEISRAEFAETQAFKTIADWFESVKAPKEIYNNEKFQTYYAEKNKQNDEKFRSLQAQFKAKLADLVNSEKTRLLQICTKYLPNNQNSISLNNAEFILNVLNSCGSNLELAEKKLIFWDLCRKTNQELLDMNIYAMDENGNIVPEKAGEFIINKDHYLENLKKAKMESDKKFIEIINEKFVNNGKNKYKEANEVLDMYMEVSDFFKPTILNIAEETYKIPDKNFIKNLTDFYIMEKEWKIEEVSSFILDKDKFNQKEDQIVLITPKAKKECWKYCNGNYERFDDLITKFYKATKQTISEKGGQGIKNYISIKGVMELKIQGGNAVGNMRMYSRKPTKEEKILYGNVKYVFDLFGNHNMYNQIKEMNKG